MSTICLSHAPILRCVGVTHTFAVTLLIPPVLALFFGLSLLFVRRNGDKYVQMHYATCYILIRSRKRLLLVGEGITYFILCLLDSLAEVVPATQFSISTFKALDMTVGMSKYSNFIFLTHINLGVLSDLPIFLYCLFLLLFVRSTLIRSFSQASQRISYLVFLLLIPAILVLNVCASFIGISYGRPPESALRISKANSYYHSSNRLWRRIKGDCGCRIQVPTLHVGMDVPQRVHSGPSRPHPVFGLLACLRSSREEQSQPSWLDHSCVRSLYWGSRMHGWLWTQYDPCGICSPSDALSGQSSDHRRHAHWVR
jgi:hypothetical protein